MPVSLLAASVELHGLLQSDREMNGPSAGSNFVTQRTVSGLGSVVGPWEYR